MKHMFSLSTLANKLHKKRYFLFALPLAGSVAGIGALQQGSSAEPDTSSRLSSSSKLDSSAPLPEIPATPAPVTNVTTSVSSSSQVSNSPAHKKVEVKVNGQSIPVPDQGSTQTVVSDNGAQVQVNVTSSNTSTSVRTQSTSTSSTNSNVQVYTSN